MALQGSVFIRSQAFPEQLLFFHKTFAPLSHQNEKAKGCFPGPPEKKPSNLGYSIFITHKKEDMYQKSFQSHKFKGIFYNKCGKFPVSLSTFIKPQSYRRQGQMNASP